MKVKQSLLVKIVTPFLAVMLITGLLIITSSYSITMKNVREETKQNAKSTSIQTEKTIDHYFAEREKDVTELANNSDIRWAMTDDAAARVLINSIARSRENVSYTYAVFKNNMILSSPTKTAKEEDGNLYKNAINHSESVGWYPYYGQQYNQLSIITIAKAIQGNGGKIGIFAMDVELNALQKTLEKTTFGKKGTVTAFDKNGTILYTEEKSLIYKNRSNEELINALRSEKKKEGEVKSTFNGETIEGYYVKNDRMGWTIVASTPTSAYVEEAYSLVKPIFGFYSIGLLIAILVSIHYIRKHLRPINELNKTIAVTEQDDFSITVPLVSNDEITDLSKTFNGMLTKIRYLIGNFEKSSRELNDASQALVRNSEENARAITQISTNMDEITKRSHKQFELAENNTSAVVTLSDSVEVIRAQSTVIKENSNAMYQVAVQGKSKMEELRKQSVTTTQNSNEMVGAIQSLHGYSTSISDIIHTISSIAEKTNLLALNAAIEASTAGEAGRGFAVVAEEIKKLAEDASESSKQIVELITETQKQTKNTVSLIEQSTTLVTEQDRIVSETERSFNDILSSVEEGFQNINQIIEMIKTVTNQKNIVFDASAELRKISAENTNYNMGISSAIEEQAASQEELKRLSEKLSEQSQLLLDEFKRFKI